MTKLTVLIAIGLSALSVPALAQHAHQGGHAPMVGASDPCVLGTNVQPGACVGPIRVAPMIMSQGGVQLQPAHQDHVRITAHAVYPQQPIYPSHPVGHAQPTVQMSGCVPGYVGPSVPCNGAWVPAPGYVQQPVVMLPATQYLAPPAAYAPVPQQVAMIPTSFFTGGITYGAGFPTDATYSYGGGGYGYSSGGGTRFSGVRERSPTPLVAPPPRQRHAPPPAHHHGCC